MPKFVKGQSGNPKGRPRDKNSLTNILENIGKDKKDLVAKHLWELAVNGQCQIGDKTYKPNLSQWFNIVTFIYNRLDGRPAVTDKDYQSSRSQVKIESVNDLLPIIEKSIRETLGHPNDKSKSEAISKLTQSALRIFEISELEERLKKLEEKL